MKNPVKSIALRIAKWLGITVASILLLLFLAPIVFPGTVAEQIKAFANKKLEGEMNFSKARLSFFNHFPSLTVTLYDFSLKGSAPYKNDTLVSAKEVAFGINLKRLIFDNQVRVDKIFISESFVNVLVNEKGEANYNVYVSEAEEPTDTVSGTSIKLEKIDISHCHLRYEDKSVKMLIEAKDFNYLGNGDLSKSVFDLKTEADIGALDFWYDKEPYLKDKNVHAELVTQINTNSLSFIFQKNDLVINKLPVKFKGKMDILKEGYDLDFEASSMNSNLKDLFTALPPEYVTWLNKTKVKGKIDLQFAFKGNYNADKNSKPDLSFGMKVTDGYIEYTNAPFPTSDIDLNFKTVLPALDTDNLSVKLDSLSFKLGKDYIKAYVETKGLERPTVRASVKGKMNLENLDKSLGLAAIDMKGLLDIDINSNGQYDAAKKTFPVTKARILLRDGMLKTSAYPNPITDINLDMNAINTTGQFKDVKVAVQPARFTFEGNPFDLKASFVNFEDVAYDIKAKGIIDIAKIYKVFSRKGIDVTGYIKADLALKGKQSDAMSGQYAKLDNRGTLLLKEIKTTTDFLPKPFVIDEGLFTFRREKMLFDKFKATYGQSDFAMNGYLNNVINFFLQDRGTLRGNFNISSGYINVDEFMALKPGDNKNQEPEIKAAEVATPTQSGVVMLPTNLDVSLNANIKKVNYDGLNLQDVKGNIAISGGKLLMKGTQFGLIGCTVNIDGTYDDASPTKAGFDVRFRARDFDVKRAYNEIKMFRELATAAEKAEGIISVDYKLNGVLDGNMDPVYPSLEGSGVVSLKKVKVNGLKMFSAISAKTGSDGLNDPDLSRVDIKTHIKNNVIYIDRTRMGVSLFKLRFEGKTSFDGQLALRMRLGLPPFGIIGIPVAITGTHENPKVKVFSKNTEPVDETEYKGEKVIPVQPTETAEPGKEVPKTEEKK